MHATIHAVDAAAAIPNPPDTYRQKDLFCKLIGYSDMLPEHLRRRCLDALDNLNDGSALCHGDMSPANLMIHKGRCFAIDWSFATIGDPAGDVAFTWVGISDLSQLGDLSVMVKAILRRASRWYLDRYRDRSGESSGFTFEHWLAPAAAARLGALEKAGVPDSALRPLISLIEVYCKEKQALGR